MTKFNTGIFPVAERPEERIRREAYERKLEEDHQGGFVENMFNRGQESAPAYLVRQLYRNAIFPDDPGFSLTTKLYDQLTDGLPEHTWHRFVDARSLEQAYSIRQDLLTTQERRQMLEASGMTGMAAAMYADLIEPTNLALGFATGGISRVAGIGKATLGTVAREAALGAVGFGGIEAYKATQDPFTTTADVAGALAGGAGFGAASEALSGFGRLARAPAVGLAGAIGPGLAAVQQQAESDQISDTFWLSFAQGAAFSFMHGKRNPSIERMAKEGYEAAARQQTIKEANALRSIKDDFLTDADRTTIAKADEILAGISNRVRQTIDGPDAIKTLDPFGPPIPPPENTDAGPVSLIEIGREIASIDLPQSRAIVEAYSTPIKNNYAQGVTADIIAEIEGDLPAAHHEIVSRRVEERAAFKTAKSRSGALSQQLGSSGLNIPKSAASVLTPEEVISQNYSYAEFRGESVDLPAARELVDDLNTNVGGRDYAVVIQSPGKYTVASKPKTTIEGTLTQMIDAAKKRRKELSVPRGRSSGATIIFDELISYAYELALRAARAGVRSASELSDFVRTAIKSGETRYIPHEEDVLRAASGLWNDGGGTEEGVALSVRKYDAARESSVRETMSRNDAAAKAYRARTTFARAQQKRAEDTTAAFSAEGRAAANEEAARTELFLHEYRSGLKGTDFDASRINDVPPPALQKTTEFKPFGVTMRASLGGMTAGDIVGASDIQTFRDFAARATHDPIPRGTDSTYYDAMTSKIKKVDARSALIEQTMREAYATHREYAITNGQKPMKRDPFFELAGIHRAKGLASPDPGVEMARTASSAHYKDMLDTQKRYKVAGADQIPDDDTYVTRIYNAKANRDLAAAAMPGELDRAYFEFANAATPDTDPRVLALMAKAIAKRAKNADQHDLDASHDITVLPTSELLDAIKNDLGDKLRPEDIALIEGHVKAKAGDASGDKPNTKRVQMDYNTVATLRMNDGTTRDVQLTDLLVNNLEHNLQMANHRAESASHFKSLMVATFPGEEVNSLSAFRRRMEQVADDAGKLPNEVSQDIEKMVGMGKHVLGVPQFPNTPLNRVLRMVREAGSILNLSNITSGLTQLPEAVDTMAFAGVDVITKHMPSVSEITSQLKAGKYSDADMRAILDAGSASVSMWTDRPTRNVDLEAHVQLTGLEDKLRRGTRAMLTYASAVRPIQAGLEMYSNYGVKYAFADRAFSPDRAWTDLDLRDMGLTRDEYNAINAQITKYGNKETLEIGRAEWDDDAAIGAFHRAFDLTTSRLVLARNPSDMPHWAANTAWGQTLAQFRSFSFMAWRNKTMYAGHRFRNGDANYATRLLLSSAANALVYAANVGIKGLGKPDAGDWYDEKLSVEEILKASFSRAAYASIVPMAIDTASSTAGFGDVFSGARTTELRGGLLNGNPTYQYVSNLSRLPRAVIGPMIPFNEYRLNRQDARAVRDLALPGIVGFRNAFEHLIEDLPATMQRGERR